MIFWISSIICSDGKVIACISIPHKSLQQVIERWPVYFLQDVAPINHFLGLLLSVLTFLFMERSERLLRREVFAPVAATLLYGVIALILNARGVIDGPYFFLQVREVSPGTIVMWYGIIAALCLVLSGLFLWISQKTLTAG